MKAPLIFAYLLLITVLGALEVRAQDTESTDDYSDYSHLWDEPKKKKKKKKSAPAAESQRVETAPASTPVVSDSLPKVVQDSLYRQPQDSIPELAQDTLPETFKEEDTRPVVQDSIPAEDNEDLVEDKKPKQKRDIKPVQDFRAGMSSGNSGSFTGGFTYTFIDGQPHVGMVLSPEFSIGKVGVGISAPVLYGLDDKSIRTEMFEDGVGVLRLIRYVRYGTQKTDPVYVRVGELGGTMIGFGGLVNNYTNTTSYEKRKVGLHYDLSYQYGLAGVEGLYSDFDASSLNLLAIRPYTRPLIWTSIPVVRSFEIGATIIRDKDQTDINGKKYAHTAGDGVSAFGIDAGFVVLSIPFVQIDLFANYSSLNISGDSLTSYAENQTVTDFTTGSGISAGANFRLNFIADLLSTDVRIERLSYKDHYLPQFFDAAYELNKDAKIQSLVNVKRISGTYGSLTGHIAGIVQLGGSLLIPDKVTAATPATVRVNADVERLADKYSMHASYIKGGLADLGDAFKFDDRSLAKVRLIYHMNKFLAVGLDYYYYWEQNSQGTYKATEYVMPYFGVSIAF